MTLALFLHDNLIYKNGDKYFSNGLPHNIWTERYLKVFKNLKVCTRVIPESEDCSNIIKLSSTENVDFDPISIGKNNIKFLTQIIYIRKHIRRLVSECDYIIARLPSVLGEIGIIYAKAMKKPYIIELVSCPWDALWNHSWKGKLVAPFFELLTKREVINAPYVIYVTSDFLQKRYPSAGKTIGCSDVALLEVDEKILSERINKIERMGNGPVIIGTIGALNVRYKGQVNIIKAISELTKQGYKYEYHLVGNGDNSYLKLKAKEYNVSDKVKFLGALPHTRIFEFLKSIDIYAQPSRLEGLPRALVEAMSQGLPAIGSRVGGIPELVATDCTFTPGNINEICTMLKRLNRSVAIQQAMKNYEKSKEYKKSILDARRIRFLSEFKNSYV